jgi:hypothetical protein
MKRILLCTFIVLLCTGFGWADASTGAKAGQVYLGVNMFPGANVFLPTGMFTGTFTPSSGSTYNQTDLSLNMEAGYFLFDGFEVGLVFFLLWDYYYVSSTNWDTSLTLGPGIQIMYVLDLGGIISPYVKFMGDFMTRSGSSDSGPQTGRNGLSFMGLLGGKLFIGKNTAIDLGLFYNYAVSSSSSGSSTTASVYGFTLGFNVFL